MENFGAIIPISGDFYRDEAKTKISYKLKGHVL